MTLESADDIRAELDLLADEFTQRLRTGDSPSIEDYVARHPEFAHDIRELFPTIQSMERMKRERRAAGRDARRSTGLPQTPHRLGDFLIVREIGRGGMGIVFEAEQESLKRRVAVKVLAASAVLDDEHVRRFRREAQAAARLHHTNIVPVFGVGEHEGYHYYVMQLIDGQGLDAIVSDTRRRESTVALMATAEESETSSSKTAGSTDPNLTHESAAHGHRAGIALNDERRAPAPETTILQPRARRTGKSLPPLAVARIGHAAADALACAHRQGVIHRDIKPANLLLDKDANVWVADFGLAKSAESGDASRAGNVSGTLRYMPPERFSGHADERGDIYGLGLTLYELIAGRPAYDESDRGRLFQQVTRATPPRLRSLAPNLSRDLETIVMKSIARDPAHRYQTATQMAQDLQRWLGGLPVHARRVGALERVYRWTRRNPLVAGLTILACGLLVAVAVVSMVGYLRTRAAWQAESKQRDRAEETLSVAVGGFDAVLDRFGSVTTGVPLDEDGNTGLTPPTISDEDAALLEKLLIFYDRLAAQHEGHSRLHDETVRAHQRVGEIQQRLGRFGSAEAAYRRGLELAQQSVEGKITGKSERVRAALHSSLGAVLRMQGHMDQSAAEYRTAIDLYRELADEPQAGDGVQLEFAATMVDAWSGRSRPRNLDQAEADLREAIQRLSSLSESTHGSFRVALPRAFRALALLLSRRQQRAEAIRAMTRSLDLLEQLVAEYPTVAEYRFELIATNLQLDLDLPGVRLPVARRRFIRAVQLADELVRDNPGAPQFETIQGQAHSLLGTVYRRMEAPVQADAELSTAIEILDRTFARRKDVPIVRQQLSLAQLEMGELQFSRDEDDAAKELLTTSIGHLEHLVQVAPQSLRLRQSLQRAYESLATVLAATGDADQAEAVRRKTDLLLQSRP